MALLPYIHDDDDDDDDDGTSPNQVHPEPTADISEYQPKILSQQQPNQQNPESKFLEFPARPLETIVSMRAKMGEV